MAIKKELTPLMKQYWGVKTAHPDKVVLFRMGDFFEIFHDDALKAAPIMGITLTVRNKKSGDQTPMCGVPHHSIAGQINKLLKAGEKVAICDQVEDPKLAKGLVKREITRILSPGMVYDPDTLDSQMPNYLCAYDAETLAFMDSTTGECFYYAMGDEQKKVRLIETLQPVEIVVADYQADLFEKMKPREWKGFVSIHDDLATSESTLPSSALRLISYAQYMLGATVNGSLQEFEKRESDFRLQVSAKVFRHLEIFKTYKGETQGTLFSAIDRTKTAGGGRRLKNWLIFPLTDLNRIKERHDEVEYWSQDLERLKSLRKKLFNVGDIERRVGKVSQPTAHPRDLKSLGDSLQAALSLVPEIRNFVKADQIVEDIDRLTRDIEKALVDDIPNNYREGSFISKGYNQTLDGYIDLATNSQSKVRELEASEREKTGITSLKVRYNNVFGYYIEVTNTHKDKVPTDRYQRKQTLTNAERYVTDELNELEKKVITAKTKRADLELELFEQLKVKTLENLSSLLCLANECNQLDVYVSLAWLALEHSYTRPQMTEEGDFNIQGSRHPVIEQFTGSNFIANDILIKQNQCILLTGPNMAGKSTVMRQIAITSLLAQIGSFVPARQAQLPVVDKIFTRIGASDFLTEGLSTFMVEMQETAEMLLQATEKSLVILDEVGRGTSTYDGMSLAQSVLEYFLGQLKSYTLFATHYHELTQLEKSHPGFLVNKHMSISESKGEILFRYHLADGPAEKSYGIQVAKLAGLPVSVVKRAAQILGHLESKAPADSDSQTQLDLWQNLQSLEVVDDQPSASDEFVETVRQLEIQKLTPLDALNKLAEWQQELS